ncbi:MAG TPA: ABC transporter ATP-binding protein [Verrucomicrobiae bacterium]|nr:ABC transporter ATP-binding protein [Verrucomicrobiae bacterium]
MSNTRKHSDFAIYRRLLLEAKPFWPNIAGLFALSLLATPLTLLNPLPLKIVVDSVLGAHELPAWLAWVFPAGTHRTDFIVLAVVAGTLVVIALLKQVLDLAFALLRSYTGEKLVLAFRAKLFRHTQGLSLSYHDTTGTADSTYRIQYDAPAIQWITIDAFIPLVSSLLTLVAMLVVMARIDWALALVALAVAPVLYIVSQIYARRLKLRWREAKDLESSMLSVVQEVLGSVRVVKAFAQEDREQERYVASAGKNLRQQLKLALTGGSFGLIIGVAMAAGTATVLFLAARHVQAGRITLGDLILVMSYLALLYTPLQMVSKSAASLQGSLVSAERAFQLLDEMPEVVEKPDARPLARAHGAVAFENVSFGYNAERPALRDISFAVAAGSRVGIAGTTGAGKSTLVSLLLRLYDPAGGKISLDDVDLRDIKLRDLRNQFAIVLQEPVLFSSSIAENIAYARPDATEAEIITAAQAANAHDFISRLPQAYKTEVGERGVQLSGGERQRISLARAFLKDAPILILDEPTSSVDVKTEAVIMEAMERLMRGRTTFMIAHRLTTLDICDVRIQLEHGRIVSLTRAAASSASVA